MNYINKLAARGIFKNTEYNLVQNDVPGASASLQ